MKEYLKKFKNTGTIIALAGLIGSLLIQFGFNLDSNSYINTIKIICNILVVLGICNNPATSGLDLPTTEDKITE